MEALLALGLTSNVVQFLEFADKVISKSHEICKSAEGVLRENGDFKIIAENIKALANDLKQPQTWDQELVQLSTECHRVAEELLEALAKLQINGRPTRCKSMRKALKSVWNKDKILEIKMRLSDFRDLLNFHISMQLRAQLNLLSVQGSEGFKLLSEANQKHLQLLIDAVQSGCDRGSRELSNQAQRIQASHEKTQHTVLQAIEDVEKVMMNRHDETLALVRDLQRCVLDTRAHQLVNGIAIHSTDSVQLLPNSTITNVAEDLQRRRSIHQPPAVMLPTSELRNAPQAFKATITATVQRAVAQHSVGTGNFLITPTTKIARVYAGNGSHVDSCGVTDATGPSDQWLTAYGSPKKQSEKVGFSWYGLGLITVRKLYTQWPDMGVMSDKNLSAAQTTVAIAFKTWFLRIGMFVQCGTTMPSLGGPLSDMRLRMFYVVGETSPITQAIDNCDYLTFRNLLDERRATPHDRYDPDLPRDIFWKQKNLLDRVLLSFARKRKFIRGTKLYALFQMAQLLIDSGVDAGESWPIGGILGDLENPMPAEELSLMRLIITKSHSHPFDYGRCWENAAPEIQILVAGQEIWDMHEEQKAFECWFGRRSWHYILIKGFDRTHWLVRQCIEWIQEPLHVKHSREACERKYGSHFVYHCWQILRLRELDPSKRASLDTCKAALGDDLVENDLKKYRDEEEWKKQPMAIKGSRVETEKRFGRWFVDDDYGSWRRLTIEEGIFANTPKLQS